jgi:hypothetical protein
MMTTKRIAKSKIERLRLIAPHPNRRFGKAQGNVPVNTVESPVCVPEEVQMTRPKWATKAPQTSKSKRLTTQNSC